MFMQRRLKKGQYFSFDAIIASTIFIITFVSLLTYWFSVKSALDSKDDDISREAARISDVMFTPAYLLSSYADNRVDSSELSGLPSDETALRKEFNSPYKIYLAFTSQSGSQILDRGEPPPADAHNVAKVRRIFVLDDGAKDVQAAMDLYLYN